MNPDRTTILFGPPGTGKTTRLLDEVENYLTKGVQPEELGFVSFTRQAAENAKGRAIEKFSIPRGRFSHFRTLHSMAFSMLALSKESVMQNKDYREVAKLCGITLSTRVQRMDEEGLWLGATHGDKIMFLENMARVMDLPIPEAMMTSEFEDVDELEVQLFAKALRSYKDANALVDYTDMLQEWFARGTVPRLKVLFVDEAQDLSRLQWQMVAKIAEQDCDVWLAGDDDQAIFTWAGADPTTFSNMPGRRIVLSQSYRIPASVHRVAATIRDLIRDSYPKEYAPRPSEGEVSWKLGLDQCQILSPLSGRWLLLVRNNYFIARVEEACRGLGLWYDSLFDPPARCTVPIIAWSRLVRGGKATPTEIKAIAEMMGRRIRQLPGNTSAYGLENLTGELGSSAPWFDKFTHMSTEKVAYYRAVLANGEDIKKQDAQGRPDPRIRISTIHGAKGGEEDNVVLFSDMSMKTWRKMQEDLGAEARVWYVGITRARKTLTIIHPHEDKYLEALIQ